MQPQNHPSNATHALIILKVLSLNKKSNAKQALIADRVGGRGSTIYIKIPL